MKSATVIFGQAPLFRNQMVLIFWKVTTLLLPSQKRVKNFLKDHLRFLCWVWEEDDD